MNPSESEIFAAIGSTEPSTFAEFCRALPNRPPKGDRDGWREVFASLEYLAHQGLLVIVREDRNIATIQLTPAGADCVREQLDAGRGLLAGI